MRRSLWPSAGDALVAVDVQNDFLPGGALAVANGDEIIGPLNRVLELFGRRKLPVFATRDWHPPGHCSFVERGGPWPPQCVRESRGAAFSPRLDTYDVDRAAAEAARLAPWFEAEGVGLRGVRLDSGDLDGQARRVRRVLDAAGLTGAKILASGDLDERKIRVSEGKATIPGRKQVWRATRGGRFAGDRLCLHDESGDGEPLLQPVMEGGAPSGPRPSLEESRALARRQLEALPEALKALDPSPAYPLELSGRLRAARRHV